MTPDPMTEAVEAAAKAIRERQVRYGELIRKHACEGQAQAAISAALPILRAQFAEEVAGAIEAHKMSLRTGISMFTFGATDPTWVWNRPLNAAAAIARNLGTK